MKFNLLITTLLFVTFSFSQSKGTLTGAITDKEASNSALPFANVAIKGTSIAVTTNETGNYSISLNPGNYVVQFSFIGYENVEKSVTIKAGETSTLNCSLGSGNYTLKDVVVKSNGKNREKETALLLEQKKAVEIKQSIGAQEMARKGVSDVEEGLTKITGISKVDGRGLFVRGLEERYNNLLINDLQAPSNSPFKKFIPLDLFPTDIVGVLNVYKTFNPNISGDFAGATINIETSQAKDSNTKLSVGFGFTTQNNGEKFLISSDANTTQGFLGLLGNNRELPSAFGNIPAGVKLTSNQYNDSFKKNSWNVDESSSPINTSIGILHSEKFAFKNSNNLNYIISINSENSYKIKEGIDRTFNQGQGNYDNNLITSQFKYLTSTSALAGIKYKANRFDVSINSFFLRSTTSIIQDQLGYTNSLITNPNIFIRLNQFEESKYWNNQLLANYSITEDKKHTLKAGFSYAKTAFGQPDRKQLTGEKISNNLFSTNYGGNNLIRQYLDVSGDRYFSGMLEYNLKLKEKENGKSNKLSFGYNGFSNEEIYSYRFIFGKPLIPIAFTTNINTIDTNIVNDVNSGLLKFTEESTGDYKSKLYQLTNSGYFNAFFNFGKNLEINGGLRAESSFREIKSRQLGDSFDAKYRKITIDKLYFLPSINAKYTLTNESNVRFASSQTITKPISIEVAPIKYINPDGTSEQGNVNIENSENLNLDLKYELFPSSNEIFTVGLFGKQIKNPIERILVASASSGGQIITYQNSKEAIIYGAEFEFLFQLNRISNQLKNFSFGLNTSIMKTNVTVDLLKNPIENNKERALQGASDWLINSDLKYNFQFNEDMKNTITFIYGISGEKIYAVGTNGLDNVYERPFSKLDFVWSSKLSKKIEAKFAIDNILNPYFKRVMGNESKIQITETDLNLTKYKKGTGLSLNLSYTF